jgi:hypothetical protein
MALRRLPRRALSVLLVFLGSAASAANAPSSDVGEDSHDEGDQKEDTNADGLVLEGTLESINAVGSGRTGSDRLEIEEEASEADAVAVQALLNVSSKLLETIADLLNLALVVRVRLLEFCIEFNQGLVAVPEVVITGLSTTCTYEVERNDLRACASLVNSSVEFGSSLVIELFVSSVSGVPVVVCVCSRARALLSAEGARGDTSKVLFDLSNLRNDVGLLLSQGPVEERAIAVLVNVLNAQAADSEEHNTENEEDEEEEDALNVVLYKLSLEPISF